jgi:RNA polymerase sigma-70 factor (ECF subfamily)
MWEASDEGLLAGYASGDQDAATVFVRRFQRQMIGLALTITRDRVDAEDVAQDAFVRAWRYAASYDPRRGAVSTWLLTIVRNVALDRVRVSSRRHDVPIAELHEDSAVDLDADTAAAATDSDAVDRILASLATLPAEQRDTLIAVMLNGLSTRELSDATGVPLGTVKTRVRLGLRRLRDELGAWMR